MYTAKGTTIYKNGVEIAFIRIYHGDPAEMYKFVSDIAAGLNALAADVTIAATLAAPLGDLIALVKAPDKNLQFYASQVRSTLYEGEKALHVYRSLVALDRDRAELDAVTYTEVTDDIDAAIGAGAVPSDDMDTLDASDVEIGALVFDESLHRNGLAQTLDMPPAVIHLDGADGLTAPKSQVVETTALLLGLDVREIPLVREDAVPAGWLHADTSVPDHRDPEEIYFTLSPVNRMERDAILAGLRMLQMAVEGTIDLNVVGGEVMEIATESGRGLLVDEIESLLDRLNS